MSTQRVSLSNIARGAAEKLFREQLDKVLDNIADPETEAKVKRSVALSVTFAPDEEKRSEITVSVAATSKLAPRIKTTMCELVTMADGDLALSEQLNLFGTQEEVEYERDTGEVLEQVARRPAKAPATAELQ